MEANLCEVCQVPAKQSCSSCHASFYCSKECQKKAWKLHKASCIPYVIEIHPVYGRYCVATRDIKPGEIIMREVPVAVGPKNMSIPLCLGCHRTVTGAYTCSKCNFPLCSPSCENSIFHETECKVLSKAKKLTYVMDTTQPDPAYECILPLRCLLTKYTDPKKWKMITVLQDSMEFMDADWKQRVELNIINYLKNCMNFKGVETDEIYRICGILTTNSFETNHNGQSVEGVFPKVAMMAHDCSPNTENIYDRTMRATVRSTVFIPKGASITTAYTSLVTNTLGRRRSLLKSKFFECTCRRCADPTELGTHYSTLVCSQCGGNVLSTDPMNFDAVWACQDCGSTVMGKEVEQTTGTLIKIFYDRDRSQIRPLENLIEFCSQKVHPSHQVPLEAKFAWIKFCGNHPEYRYKDISKDLLLRKISYCKDLLQMADAIFPGRNQYRGYFLYELFATLKTVGKRLHDFGETNNKSAQDYLSEAESILQEVKEIFCFENEMQDRGLENKLEILSKELDSLP
ncbi:SET domain-containing protein SmydA-8-like [Macrobrachium rosenbergii]|uniref:SET domain-containing protein SmydA-8-like n=1 Tax=Macrobrachium rosenbergii TaxID=79674 RepID=UPI0034D5E9A7